MFGITWLAYFEGNARADRPAAATLASEVPEALRAPLAISLGRFQLGESAGGRIHEEMATRPDRALDGATRRSIQLYIEEEWRHARELASIIAALGGKLQSAHWTNGAFTACRRILGLRTKMMTLAIAEVVGIVYYRTLASAVGSPALATSLRRIANEESQHLTFQAAFFDHALSHTPAALRLLHRWLLRGLMLTILVAALLVLLLDHRAVLRGLGASQALLVRACWRELTSRAFLAPPRLAGARRPRYAWQHD